MDVDKDFYDFRDLWQATLGFYNQQPTDATVAMAFRALAHYSLEDVKRALTSHVQDADKGQYPPKPADVEAHIRGDSQSQAMAAWTKVERALRTVGPHQTVCFDDEKIMAVLEDMGGWIKLAEITEQELPHRQREFQTRYQRMVKAPPQHHPARLPGLAETRNRGMAKPPDPILIGDSTKALEVHDDGKRLTSAPIRAFEAAKKLYSEPDDETQQEHDAGA